MIGLPGHPPRLCVSAEDQAHRLARSGEAVIAAPAAGDYIISQDGLSVIATAPAPSAAWAQLRMERDARLARSDWTQLADVPLAPDQREAWSQYRQALRDLPEQADGDPSVIAWPPEPGAAA
ncbi:tail fiber assembly protein [Sphingobium sp. Z007]|uniref:tail fiber assembly protein n=1 Tax=Sphingobium sp. Z007 TaxID=627495 RepID=UPI0020CE9DAB|nr:tail fiber assembly protein [Sphingobium sp. Z007]